MKKSAVVFGCCLVFLLAGSDAVSMEALVVENWIMGCDNQHRCTAIGYDDPKEAAVDPAQRWHYNPNPAWYVVATWHQTQQASLTLQFHILDSQPVNPDMALLQLSGIKRPYPLQAAQDKDRETTYLVTTTPEDVLAQDILIFSYSYQDMENNTTAAHKGQIDLAHFKDFLRENRIPQAKHNMPEAVTAYPWSNKRRIESALLKTWQDQYGQSSDAYCYREDTNYTMDIAPVGTLVVLCAATGYNHASTLWKRNGDTLIPFNFSSGFRALIGYSIHDYVDQNYIDGFYEDEADRHLFYLRSKGRGFGDCGAVYTLVFNGQQFDIVRYEHMPVCAHILQWIPLYDRSFKRQ